MKSSAGVGNGSTVSVVSLVCVCLFVVNRKVLKPKVQRLPFAAMLVQLH